jgi:hypothetical protein
MYFDMFISDPLLTLFTRLAHHMKNVTLLSFLAVFALAIHV